MLLHCKNNNSFHSAAQKQNGNLEILQFKKNINGLINASNI